MKNNLDVLFVSVGGTRKKVYQELSKDFSAVDTPFWAAMAAGFIRNNDFSVNILDANAENLDIIETAKRVEWLNPMFTAIVVYSQQANVCTPIMVAVGQLCREIKNLNPNIKVILTGWHPSALPERTLTEEECDFVAVGEGFYTLLGLLRKDPLTEIPGLWWKSDGRILHNARANNVENMDMELSDIAWDLLPLDDGKYRAFSWMCLQDLESRNRFVSMFTSLGCPFKCSFCAIHATYGERRIRYWSTGWVLEQLDILINMYKVKNINLIDELFIFNREHYIPIAQGIVERGYDLNFCAFARVDVVNKIPDDDLVLLKKAGFNWFKLGIESSSSKILKKVSKGRFDKEIVRNVVKKIHKAGIDICANFMFGLPGDTWDTMQENLDFALELQCSFPSFFCTMAIPGSDLYEEALSKGIPVPDTWLGYATQGYDFFPLPTEDLTSAEVVSFRDYAFDTYFKNPRYLSMIKGKFGLKAREHIEDMTRVKLKRKILKNEVKSMIC
jgi:radical SAM superfamily enzyme YgiQ (UPF0313 family)